MNLLRELRPRNQWWQLEHEPHIEALISRVTISRNPCYRTDQQGEQPKKMAESLTVPGIVNSIILA